MTADRPIGEDELHAFLDGALEEGRHAAVRRYLDAHPEEQARLAAYRRQGEALREALAPFADQALPAELSLKTLAERRRKALAGRHRFAAAVAILCIGGLSGWFGRAAVAPPARGIDALGREAVDNYTVYASDTLRPVELASDQRATLTRWVSERLDAPVQAPDLQGAGYGFLGGRLVTTPNGPAALFVYDGTFGDRLTVMVRPMEIDRNSPMSERSYGMLDGVTWSKNGLGFSVVAPRASTDLLPVAEDVRRQASFS
ncbi:MAG: anti-sigma factor [Alphaproteobacteria bacterium]|uniref:anti-sigma factor family protein n=1 Tax=Brevundimonas sp. TaxID=1871086 RepID=UPI000DB2EC66|nr:anti-sigma factor [Alphaproteobacteria bacterium]MBU1520376.1 anti-sigma factor [Alphaproteobacteria bacterium]MBU2029838.1 anti-sigma factor [Alphaproteobacteria bacterium]MBU2164664.1 anti-sigma factor [Alphaproteobacteria bacterium]MBU2231435.1 anti-sigma factor [Alphaproteobacteria bacterium]